LLAEEAKLIEHRLRGCPEFLWTADLDVFRIPRPLADAGFVNLNLNLVTIGANGLFVQAGAGVFASGAVLPVSVGVAHIDRDDGSVRWFADGLEETIGVLSTGPDGALYLGNSPFRRIASFVLAEAGQFPPTPPVIGGITKWAPKRLDLLARDAVCAAADRLANAAEYRSDCPESAAADVIQVSELIVQARTAASVALSDGDLSPRDWSGVGADLRQTEQDLSSQELRLVGAAAERLGRGCDRLQ
jgi:hypothetical protein